LADAFTALGSDDATRCAIVIGAGRAFCAGATSAAWEISDVVAGRKRSQGHHRMIKSLHNLESR
jgi:enoyl-CoA hydratase/carnithine racemase